MSIRAADSPIPGALQQLLREYQVKGSVAVEASGDLPLADPRQAKIAATIDLPSPVGRLPGANSPLDELGPKSTARPIRRR